jgi:asparagine synthetase B (glutamine-hydrolysing)
MARACIRRRLAIFDLSDAGKQPIANADGTIWGTYNDKLYHTAGKKGEAQHGRTRHFGRRSVIAAINVSPAAAMTVKTDRR